MLKKYKVHILLIVLLFAIVFFYFSINDYKKRKNLFIKPGFDTSAIVGIPTVEENTGYKLFEIDDGYNISVCGNAIIENNKIKLYLTSNKDNNVYIKVRIFKNNEIIGESGLIKPGEYLESIKVKNTKSGDNISLNIMGYNPENYYSRGTLKLNLVVG